MSDLAEMFIASVVDGGESKFLIMHPEIEAYLGHSTSDASLFSVVDEHLKKFGKLPARSTIEEAWGTKLPKPVENAAFYLDKLRPMHVRRMLQKATMEAQPMMKDNPEKGLEIIERTVYLLRTQSQGLHMVDLRESKSFLLKHLSSKWSGDGFHPIGWSTYDKLSGGLQAGDLVVFVGKTGLGKTMMMLSRAYHLWQALGLRVLFVSMEMSLPAILERAASMHSKVPLDYLKQGLFPNLKIDFKKVLTNKLDDAKKAPNPFWFVDGNLAVKNEDLLRLCSQLQPDLVVVDGAYLLGGTSYSRRYETVSESATFLKQVIATKFGIPVMASYQFNKEGAKTKKGEQAVVQDIAGSMEIGNLATSVLGLFQGDTPETIHRRMVEILKGRNGESGRFYTQWDFINMNFDEIDESGYDEKLLEIT